MTDVRILALRRKLHENAELSMHEQKTQQILKDFLQENTDLQIIEQPGFFCGLRKAEKARRGPIALRADIDALPALNGAAHYCGHDGHSAILANVAMLESGCQRDRDVYFLFQPGEETGQGARICEKFLEENGVEEIYGLHNIPGFPLNQILLKNGTFACGSVGLAITFKGAVSHAAYPEAGKNPAGALAALVLGIERLIERQRKDDILMATVIGIDAGSDNYGISAGEGTLRLTVRAEKQEQLTALLKEIRQLVKLLAEKYGLEYHVEEKDYFPATENHIENVEKLRIIAHNLQLSVTDLSEPMHWSEDFGNYLVKFNGAFFGVGAGEDHPQLHTSDYQFPDEIIDTASAMLRGLLEDEPLEVVAGLIWKDDRFLIAQRPADKARGNMWEFVGGKKEAGESYQQALKRELQEELGIEVAVGDLAVDTIYSYPDLDVHLNLFNCQIIAGQPRLLEHQDLRWISRQETADYQFCPADRQLLQLLFKD